jgi:pheromone shutdown protein TraB
MTRRLQVPVVYGDRDADVTMAALKSAMNMAEMLHMMTAAMGTEGKEIAKLNMQLLDSGDIAKAAEVMKNRSTVSELVGLMRRSAPALVTSPQGLENAGRRGGTDTHGCRCSLQVRVMLDERDALMAQRLLELEETTVAVVGIAHMDGIEKNFLSASPP